MMCVKVMALVLAVALVQAAPVPESSLYDQMSTLYDETLTQEAPKSLYEQSADLYEEMVEVKAAPEPFKTVQESQDKVYKLDNTTNTNQIDWHSSQIKAQFEISAARDAAEAKATKEQNDIIEKKRTDYLGSANTTAAAASAAEKEAAQTATKTDEDTTTAVHKILHPDPEKKEQADKHFLNQMKKVAEGSNVVVGSGKYFEPDQIGDPNSDKLLSK